jgi:hypothetical protein
MPGTFNASPLTLPPKVIVNHCSDGTLLSAGDMGQTYANCLTNCLADKVLSGALTADTYKEVLSVIGAGVIDICAVVMLNTTSRTLGLKLTIDGVDAFSAISAATTVASDGLLAVGVLYIGATATYGSVVPQSRVFNTSLSVSIRSSISETDKIAALVDYYTI